MYNDPSCKPWNSRRWCPAGFAKRDAFIESLAKNSGPSSTNTKRPRVSESDGVAVATDGSGSSTPLKSQTISDRDVEKHDGVEERRRV